MKRIALALAAVVMLSGSSGCHLLDKWRCRTANCHTPACGAGGGACSVFSGARLGNGFGGGGGGAPVAVQGGPPAAQVAYPYYTTRGPRDFLNPNPPSIGY